MDNQQDNTVDNQQNNTVDNQKDNTVDNQKDNTVDNQQDNTVDNQQNNTVDNQQEDTTKSNEPQTSGFGWVRRHPIPSVMLCLIAFGFIVGQCSGSGYDPDNAPFGNEERLAYQKEYCDKDVLDACHDAGRLLSKLGRGKEAFPFYKKGCELGGNVSCYNTGIAYYNGEYVEEDLSKAIEYFERSCDLGKGTGCALLADCYNGRIDRFNCSKFPKGKDKAKAFEYYKKSCDARDPDGDGCYEYGMYYEAGIDVPKDHLRAIQLCKKACRHGSDMGCKDYSDLVTR